MQQQQQKDQHGGKMVHDISQDDDLHVHVEESDEQDRSFNVV